jgi:hypothetical protein
MKKTKVLFLTMLLSLSLACGLTNAPAVKSTQTVGSKPSAESKPTLESKLTEIPISEPTSTETPIPIPTSTETPIPTPTSTETPIPTATSIPSAPVGIREGLASLNTYILVIASNITGPTQADFSHTRFEIKTSNDPNAIASHYVVSQSAAGDSQSTQTDSYAYTIGDAQCSGSDADGWDYTTTTPQQTEMLALFTQMIDVVPLIDTPTFVGSETMNGIMTNHFTFQISGMGLQSGAEVKTNQGDYWLAQDGQYIVKYSLVIETADTTTQAILHMDLLIDLTDINQPVNITFPAGCVP